MDKIHFIEEALDDIKAGKMIIVVDDEDRENEGDLIMAAEKVTPTAINFMIQEGRGLVCAPVSREIAEKFKLEPMVKENTALLGTNFTVSIDYRYGTSTGISAPDRAKTIQALTDPASRPEDFGRPGHIFPLVAEKNGVLARPGHTEAAVDLPLLAGLRPVGVLCEIIGDDGEMSRLPELKIFAEKHKLKLISIQDLISYRLEREK